MRLDKTSNQADTVIFIILHPSFWLELDHQQEYQFSVQIRNFGLVPPYKSLVREKERIKLKADF